MKKPAIISEKTAPRWYEEENLAANLQHQSINSAIDDFTDFFSAACVCDHLHELLGVWLDSPDAEHASRVEVANKVYLTTSLMTFITLVSSKWDSIRYIHLRDKGTLS